MRNRRPMDSFVAGHLYSDGAGAVEYRATPLSRPDEEQYLRWH
jgi:hypothetical protein